MDESRGEAAGQCNSGVLQHHNTRQASVPAFNQSANNLSGAMTRTGPSTSDQTSPVRIGPHFETRGSIADLLNSSNSLPTMRSLAENNPRKRKLPDPVEDIQMKRRRIVEHQMGRLKRIKKEFVDFATEMLNLDGCGLMDIYRKQPSIPVLLNYFTNNPLDPKDPNEDLISLLSPMAPQPDLKVGITAPVTSTTPARSASIPKFRQPIFPTTEHETSSTATLASPSPIPDKRSVATLLSPVKSSAVTVASCSTPNNSRASYDSGLSLSSQEQIVEKAKQEAQVMQRIGELQRDGLWAEKRLPKVQEAPRTKAHWDYLLEEMVWLAADFAQERKWKKAAAKKCAKMVQKYFQDKELMAQKAVKSQELQLKRIASCMAKEIKQFWANVEKLVEYKQQAILEEKRKKALDQHLSFIVDQTEKYSSLVAESMNKTAGEQESLTHSVESSRAPSPPLQHHTSDVEFEPGGDSSDDEETIAKAEADEEKEEGVDRAKEIELLQQESELPLEDLLQDYLEKRDHIEVEDEDDDASSVDNQDRDAEFRASDKDSTDDEETIQEQEKAEGKLDYKQEIDELQAENEMSVEELKAKYSAMQTNGDPMDAESQDSETDEDQEEEEEEDDEAEEAVSSSEDEDMEVDVESTTEDLSTLLTEETSSSQQLGGKEVRDAEINNVAAIAESIQPKGNTLSSTSVVTKIPFLLKHTLREYQHIGLDWLVTMHDRKLNGILADEMGLGKTIQTIAVLAHLACEKGTWGPHLIVVPTSVMLNWEMEFKKWCPAFKILTYYGTQKERKMKRTGWTKPNAFHVCITSYKLVIQDHQSFRRKAWKYLILDEAQNIKNFKSQRWQLLLNFQTQRRLLLTGTPLQNNLMELWSLMHFLMPNVFQSHREFKEWFSNPVTGMIEGNSEYNEQIIKRLHKVLRPFLLRRLKCEVEKQLPKKYEHVVMCRLSNRQRYLYEDFMSRAKTKETLATGSLLSVINVLMQLRKVCNHPNLFEVRPTVSPFQMQAIEYFTASCVWSALDYDPFKNVNLEFLNLRRVNLELWMSAFMGHRTRMFCTPAKLIEEIDSAPPSPPPCPPGRIRVHVRYNHQEDTQAQLKPGVLVGAGVSNTKPTLIPRSGPPSLVRTAITNQAVAQGLALRMPSVPGGYAVQLVQNSVMGAVKVALGTSTQGVLPTGFAQLVQTSSGQHLLFTSTPQLTTPTSSTAVVTAGGQRLLLGSGALNRMATPTAVVRLPVASTNSDVITTTGSFAVSSPLSLGHSVSSVEGSRNVVIGPVSALYPDPSLVKVEGPRVKTNPVPSCSTSSPSTSSSSTSIRARRKLSGDSSSSIFVIPRLEEKRRKWRQEKLEQIAAVNEQRCTASPLYGWDLIMALRLVDLPGVAPCSLAHSHDPTLYWHQTEALSQAVLSVEERLDQLRDALSRFVVHVPAVNAPQPRFHVSHPPPWKLHDDRRRAAILEAELSSRAACLHTITSAMMTQFPDPSLIQYDCGKLQSLDRLLRRLKSGHHRVLIFTQMTRMLDVLEAFLNFHGHIYLRLDGTTKVDQRQLLMERFNGDKRIFCFILSTRSGGVGVNLTGADTVIFYDSDWNPTMDAQAQDRCHRIGQTRDVHIYRLVSEKTVEENILKKANQKRMLGDLAIEGGNFTTAFFKSSTIQDLFSVDVSENDASARMADVLERDAERRVHLQNEDTQQDKAALGVLESALAAAEDEPDVAAAKTAKAEAVADLAEFDESIPLDQEAVDGQGEEISKAEQEVNALIQQLSAVERYAMRFLEETEEVWSAEQLAAAEAEIEKQKREWEEERLAALQRQLEQEERAAADASEELLTYAREDAENQVHKHNNSSATKSQRRDSRVSEPRTRSRATVDIDLWTLDDSPTTNQTKKPVKPSPVFVVDTKKAVSTKIQNHSSSSSPSLPVPAPYSNPNLVIRTRRASTNPVVSKKSWEELNNHVSDPCLVGRKLARLNRDKLVNARSEGNGPVL